MASDIYLTDEQIAHRLGMTLAEWAAAAHVLERVGLPQRSTLFGDRRHWPAVQDYLYARERRVTKTVPAERETPNGFKSAVPRPKKPQGRDNIVLLAGHKNSAGDGIHAADAADSR